MKLPEKVAYLKGLMDGMKIDETSDNGKLFSCISEILEDVALQIEDLQDQVDEVVEAVDDIDGDLSEINEFMFGDEFEEDDDSDDLDLFSSDDDILALVEDYDGIGEEMFDEEDDDEEIDLSDIEPFDDDTDDLPEAFEIDSEDDDDNMDEIDSISPADTDFIEEEDDEQLETEELYEVICPTCKDKIHLTESMLATGSIDCPGCGEHLEFDLSDEG